eukprot:g54244.t1
MRAKTTLHYTDSTTQTSRGSFYLQVFCQLVQPSKTCRQNMCLHLLAGCLYLRSGVDKYWLQTHVMFLPETWGKVRQAAQAIANADALFIGCGKGMVRLPVWAGFGLTGLTEADMNYPWWFNRPRISQLSADEVATEPTINFAWGYWRFVHRCLTTTPPHPSYAWMRGWCANMQYKGFVITENSDGLWQSTGWDTEMVYECHGNVRFAQCVKGRTAKCKETVWRNKELESLETDLSNFTAVEPLPVCQYCEGEARPNVLLAKDVGFLRTREAQQSDRLVKWITRLNQARFPRILVLELGN